MSNLAQLPWPAPAAAAALASEEAAGLLAQLPEWRIVDGHHLSRRYRCVDFRAALALVNRIGALAEQVDHHPDILLKWGLVEVSIWTHTIDALSQADFIFAARCEQLAGDSQ